MSILKNSLRDNDYKKTYRITRLRTNIDRTFDPVTYVIYDFQIFVYDLAFFDRKIIKIVFFLMLSINQYKKFEIYDPLSQAHSPGKQVFSLDFEIQYMDKWTNMCQNKASDPYGSALWNKLLIDPLGPTHSYGR